jgi:hypothetical protein
VSARQVTCYIAECDDCGDEYEHDYTPHWPSEAEATDDAVSCGEWWTDGTTLLCSDCKDKPHAFVADDFDKEACARCPNPAEEHGEVPS